MLLLALILVVGIAVLAASFRRVPPDSIGVVDRLGRLLPDVHKPGWVVMKPYIERLVVIPTTPFPIQCSTEGDAAGSPVKLTMTAQCWIQDAFKFQLSIPPKRYHDAKERAALFVTGLMNSEGRALLREHFAATEAAADAADAARSGDFSERLAERIEWHARNVGIKVTGVRVSGFDVRA